MALYWVGEWWRLGEEELLGSVDCVCACVCLSGEEESEVSICREEMLSSDEEEELTVVFWVLEGVI